MISESDLLAHLPRGIAVQVEHVERADKLIIESEREARGDFLGVIRQRLVFAVAVECAKYDRDVGALRAALDQALRHMLANLPTPPADAAAWLDSPHPELGGRPPRALIAEGRADQVVALIARMAGAQPP